MDVLIALALAASALELFQQGDFQAATAAAQATLVEQPSDVDARLVLGRAQLELGDAAGAVATLEDAARIAPENAEVHYRLGQARLALLPGVGFLRRMSLGRDIGHAFARAVQLAPDNPDYHWAYFEFCRHAPPFAGGGRKRTLHELAVLDRLDAGRGHRARAALLADNGDMDKAEAELKAAVASAPDEPDHRFALGYFYQDASRWDDAFATFQEIARRFPEERQALFQIGKTASLSGTHTDEGLSALREYLAHKPGPEEPPLSWAHYRLGLLLARQNERDAARREFEAALSMDEHLDEARSALADLRRG